MAESLPGFDPLADFNDVNPNDLVLAPPKEDLPERGDSSGEFAERPFAPDELGVVKDLQEKEDKDIGSKQSSTEVSDAEKKSVNNESTPTQSR